MKKELIIILSIMLFFSCDKDNTTEKPILNVQRITKSITYNNINVDVIIDKPTLNEVDVLLVFQGQYYLIVT